MRTILLATATVLAMSGAAAYARSDANIKMTVKCQQNRSDGRILVDGALLPNTENMHYHIQNYIPKSSAGGWTFGVCQIELNAGDY
jgi:hypothetical protein